MGNPTGAVAAAFPAVAIVWTVLVSVIGWKEGGDELMAVGHSAEYCYTHRNYCLIPMIMNVQCVGILNACLKHNSNMSKTRLKFV